MFFCQSSSGTDKPTFKARLSTLWLGRKTQRYVKGPHCKGLGSYLFIQQLFIFPGVTEENVSQLGPHIFVLEVTDLREPYTIRKKEKGFQSVSLSGIRFKNTKAE